MEDIEGDRKYGCRTMPIVWGLNASKVFVAVWIIVLVASLAIVQVYVLRISWSNRNIAMLASTIYSLCFILLPLAWIFKQLFNARSAADFHKLSTVVKLVMLTGILSMLFFKFYS